jgi:CheY-like chemotaxis protein
MTAAEQRRPLRVLIVEDYEDTAATLSTILTFDNHDVRIANTGPAAIESVQTYWPDVVLLDITLPGCDGYQVARCIREQCDNKPRPLFIVISGHANQAARVRSEAEGIYLHFAKPADLDLLRGLLQDFAVQRRLNGTSSA